MSIFKSEVSVGYLRFNQFQELRRKDFRMHFQRIFGFESLKEGGGASGQGRSRTGPATKENGAEDRKSDGDARSREEVAALRNRAGGPHAKRHVEFSTSRKLRSSVSFASSGSSLTAARKQKNGMQK